MKKTLLLTGVLLALTASLASAQTRGLDLSWFDCATDGNQNQAFLCNSNNPSWHLFGGMMSGQSITSDPLFTADRSWVDFQNANPTLDDWWKMNGSAGSTDCRQGSYVATHTQAAMGGSFATCDPTLLGPGNTSAINNWFDNVGSNPANTARLDMIVARADAGGQVDGTIEYQIFDLKILALHTTGTGACAGCQDPNCIVYQQCELDRADGSFMTVTGSLHRNWATWQGGVVPGSGCPLAVPTQQRTWGQLKSLYR